MDEQEREKLRAKRRKARKRKKAKKRFMMFLTIVIVVLAAFVITIKICNPDFDFASLIPKEKTQQIVELVNENILGKTTVESTTEKETTTQQTTKPENYDYVEFSDFAFDTSLQGNQLGNLLNKTDGSVTYSSSYIYYSVAGKGIYRFEPNEEKNSKVSVDDKYNLKYLNVLGDYIYALDTDSNVLKKMPVSGGDMVNVSDNISFAYLYNDKIYFVSTNNEVGYIQTSDFSKTVLYSGQGDKTITFAGISLSRIFFVQYDNVADYYEYITVSIDDQDDRQYFMDDTKGDDITKLYFECGYMYYYKKQSDGSFNLCRQKFGSEKVVTLLENCSVKDYPVVYSNRLYYTELDNSTIKAKELNMNSMDIKTMLSVSDADDTGTMGIGYGYQYVFLIGTKTSQSDIVYKGSSIYTSSSKDNTLTFKNDGLTY